MEKGLYCGMDLGSSTTKAVVLDRDRRVVASAIVKTRIDFTTAMQTCLNLLHDESGIDPETFIHTVATGYGRDNCPIADKSVTEITCQARGCSAHIPGQVTIVDLGGQDTKVIRLDSTGRQTSFKMNRKCAAGTGSFIEEIALKLDLPIETLPGLAERADNPATLGSYCTVFTKTEILHLIRKGVSVENIVYGVYESVVKRVTEMIPLRGTVVLTGGVVAHHRIVAEILRKISTTTVVVPPLAQLSCALGAALIAMDDLK